MSKKSENNFKNSRFIENFMWKNKINVHSKGSFPKRFLEIYECKENKRLNISIRVTSVSHSLTRYVKTTQL